MIGTIIGLLITGLIVGALARLVIPGRQDMSLVMTVLVGAVGALIGGLIARAITDSVIVYYIIAVAVAALLVYLMASMGTRNRARL